MFTIIVGILITIANTNLKKCDTIKTQFQHHAPLKLTRNLFLKLRTATDIYIAFRVILMHVSHFTQ